MLFWMHQRRVNLRPEVMKRFEEMINTVFRLSEQVVSDRERAETAADDAINAATSAAVSKDEAEELKNQTQQSAEAAAGNAQQTAQDVTTTATARDDAERFAGEAENSAQSSGTSRMNQSMPPNVPAFIIMPHHQLQPARKMQQMLHSGMKNSAAEYARQAKASQDAGTMRRKRNSTGMRRSR